MANIKFGFSDSNARSINLDVKTSETIEGVLHREPSLLKCIGCGNCAAMCTAGHFTDLKFYRLNLYLKRGMVEEIRKEAQNCMLCGKCQLTCPRGVNIRHAVLLMSSMCS